MATSGEVFRKIKEMSQRTYSPQHRILLKDISSELVISYDTLLVLLTELKDRGVIRIHKTAVVSVSLTNYGINNEEPPTGYNSEA